MKDRPRERFETCGFELPQERAWLWPGFRAAEPLGYFAWASFAGSILTRRGGAQNFTSSV